VDTTTPLLLMPPLSNSLTLPPGFSRVNVYAGDPNALETKSAAQVAACIENFTLIDCSFNEG
jgi:hypothetical protein